MKGMRRILITFLVVLLAVTCFGQVQTGGSTAMALAEKMLSGRLNYSTSVLIENKSNKVKYQLRTYGSPAALKYNKLYFLGEIDDSTAIFSHTRGIYLGSYIQEKNKPTFIRSGFGIDKIQVDSSIDDVVRYEYYIGFYKKNRRHGEGYIVRPSGKIFAAKWKRGRLIQSSRRELYPYEVEKVNDCMRFINNMM